MADWDDTVGFGWSERQILEDIVQGAELEHVLTRRVRGTSPRSQEALVTSTLARPASDAPAKNPDRPPRRIGFGHRLSRWDLKLSPYLYISPFFILFAIVGLFPIAYTAVISFMDWGLVRIGGEIVGFDFNRELHHISLVPGSKENGSSRVCMKVLSFFSRQISPSDSHLAAPVSPSPCFNSSQLTLVGSCAPYLSGSFPRVSSSYRAAWPAARPRPLLLIPARVFSSVFFL